MARQPGKTQVRNCRADSANFRRRQIYLRVCIQIPGRFLLACSSLGFCTRMSGVSHVPSKGRFHRRRSSYHYSWLGGLGLMPRDDDRGIEVDDASDRFDSPCVRCSSNFSRPFRSFISVAWAHGLHFVQRLFSLASCLPWTSLSSLFSSSEASKCFRNVQEHTRDLAAFRPHLCLQVVDGACCSSGAALAEVQLEPDSRENAGQPTP